MKLQRIFIEELFGCYKYDICLADYMKSHVTIIDAPNGMGKTTMLRLVQAVLEGDVQYIDTIPFSKFELEFDDGQKIVVIKNNTFSSILSHSVLEVRSQLASTQGIESSDSEKDGIILDNIKYFVNNAEYRISLQRDFLMMIMRRFRMDRDYLSTITVSDVLSRDDYNNEDVFLMDGLIAALSKFSESLKIYFIKTNRLYRKSDEYRYRGDRFRGRSESESSMISAVELYKKKLQKEILAAGKLFADKSEELDRTFPQRVLNTIFKGDKSAEIFDKENIEKLLEELVQTRSELSELGLITGSGDSLVKIPARESLTDETRIFLTNYIEDNITKLEIYKKLAEKLELLRNIVNERNVFSDKEMKFNSKEGVEFISSRNGRKIPIDRLSSGEKNNFVLFYELIFECGDHSLILVDEPEISLHVAWQRQFIDELNEICKLKSLQGIVATHSPDIVGVNIEIMVDLEDLSDGED